MRSCAVAHLRSSWGRTCKRTCRCRRRECWSLCRLMLSYFAVLLFRYSSLARVWRKRNIMIAILPNINKLSKSLSLISVLVILLTPVLPVLLFFPSQLEFVIQSIGSILLPVLKFHSEGVLGLTGDQVNSLITQPVLSTRITKSLWEQHIMKPMLRSIHLVKSGFQTSYVGKQ